MNESEGYVVYFFPQALEALGDAIKPYLGDGPGGEHVRCKEIDTAGSLIEMSIVANTPDGREFLLELMVPQSMVKMIVSARSDAAFGFSPRVAPALMATLPAVPGGPAPAEAATEAVPRPSEAPATKTKPAAVQATSEATSEVEPDAKARASTQAKLPPEG